MKLNKPAELLTGYELNKKSYYSVIVPKRALNLVYNPEPKTLNGYTGINSTLSLIRTLGRGSDSLNVVNTTNPTGGAGFVYQLETALAAGKPYTISFDLIGTGQFSVSLSSSVTTDVEKVTTKVIHGTGVFQRYSVTVSFSLDFQANQIKVLSLDPAVESFVVSGLQLEESTRESTYISGSVGNGSLDYAWLGVPNNSISLRSANAVDGGELIPLNELGLEITSESGLGIATETVDQDGATYAREITISGAIRASSPSELASKRARIHACLFGADSDRNREVYFAYQYADEFGPIGARVIFGAKYVSGANRVNSSITGEDFSYVFKLTTPLLLDGIHATSIPVGSKDLNNGTSNFVTNVPMASRTASSGYSFNFPTAAVATPTSNMHYAVDGNLYVGVGQTLYKTNSDQEFRPVYTAFFTGRVDEIRAIESTPDGYLWVGYLSSDNISNIMRINLRDDTEDPDAHILVTGSYGKTAVNAIRFMPTKNWLVFGGSFVEATKGNNKAVVNIAAMDMQSSTIIQLGPVSGAGLGTDGSIPDATVRAIEIDSRGLIWAGGNFANVSASSTTEDDGISSKPVNLAFFDATNTWKFAGSPVRVDSTPIVPAPHNATNAEVRAIRFDPTTGIVYVGGVFNAMWSYNNGIYTMSSANVIAIPPGGLQMEQSYLGRAYKFGHWDDVGYGLINTVDRAPLTGIVRHIEVGDGGLVMIGGTFSRIYNREGAFIKQIIGSGATEYNPFTKRFEQCEFYATTVGPMYIATARNAQRYSFSSSAAPTLWKDPYYPNERGVVSAYASEKTITERAYPVKGISSGGSARIELTGPAIFYKIENVTNGDIVKSDELFVQGDSSYEVNLSSPKGSHFIAGGYRNEPSNFRKFGSLRISRGENIIRLGYHAFSTYSHIDFTTSRAVLMYQPELSSVDEALLIGFRYV